MTGTEIGALVPESHHRSQAKTGHPSDDSDRSSAAYGDDKPIAQKELRELVAELGDPSLSATEPFGSGQLLPNR